MPLKILHFTLVFFGVLASFKYPEVFSSFVSSFVCFVLKKRVNTKDSEGKHKAHKAGPNCGGLASKGKYFEPISRVLIFMFGNHTR